MKPSIVRTVCSGLVITAALLVASTEARAFITLQDGNATALVDLNSSAGMYRWEVDGVNHLNQQWFWYRVGSGAQASIDTISPVSATLTGLNKLNATYANSQFSVNIDYTLTGSGGGEADITEAIIISNLSGTALPFTFYQYSDFNLFDSGAGDSVLMDETLAWQVKGSAGVAEGIIDPLASRYEANTVGGAGSTLFRLANTPGLDLNNNPAAGPGDVTWAFQWDFLIQPGETAIINKDKLVSMSIVPEPSAFALLGLGLAGLLMRRRL